MKSRQALPIGNIATDYKQTKQSKVEKTTISPVDNTPSNTPISPVDISNQHDSSYPKEFSGLFPISRHTEDVKIGEPNYNNKANNPGNQNINSFVANQQAVSDGEFAAEMKRKKRKKYSKKRKPNLSRASNNSLKSENIDTIATNSLITVCKTVIVPEHSRVLQHPGPFR